MAVSSYGDGTESSGIVRIVKDLDESIEGKNVLLVEDIVDTGRTLSHLTKLLGERKPASLAICTLLDKPERRECEVEVKYKGFWIPDIFVVGYGIDYQQRYRGLPYIGGGTGREPFFFQGKNTLPYSKRRCRQRYPYFTGREFSFFYGCKRI